MEWSGALAINWDVAVNVLDLAVARPLFERFVALVETAAENPTMLEETVGGRIDPTDIDCTGDRGAGRAARAAGRPRLRALPEARDRPAIATLDAVLTHAALAVRVAGIVDALIAAGIGRSDTVAIRVEKSPEQVAACLAVSLIGAVYVPLDIAQPLARRARILAISRRPPCSVTAPFPMRSPAACRSRRSTFPSLPMATRPCPPHRRRRTG